MTYLRPIRKHVTGKRPPWILEKRKIWGVTTYLSLHRAQTARYINRAEDLKSKFDKLLETECGIVWEWETQTAVLQVSWALLVNPGTLAGSYSEDPRKIWWLWQWEGKCAPVKYTQSLLHDKTYSAVEILVLSQSFISDKGRAFLLTTPF